MNLYETKQQLKKIKWLDKVVKSKTDQLENLRSTVFNVSGNSGDEKVQTSKRRDKIGDIMPKIMDLEKELNNHIKEFIDLKSKITKKIDELPDIEYRLVLMLRYLDFKTWEEIAEMMNYSRQWVTKIHGRALNSLQKLLEVYK